MNSLFSFLIIISFFFVSLILTNLNSYLFISLFVCFTAAILPPNLSITITDDMKTFWSTLSTAQLQSDGKPEDYNCKPGDLLILPQNSFILGAQNNGSKLYIRPCYKALWAAIQTLFSSPKSTLGVLIIGNPGIGLFNNYSNIYAIRVELFQAAPLTD